MAPSTHVPADDACTPARAAGRAFAVALALLIGGCSLAPRHDAELERRQTRDRIEQLVPASAPDRGGWVEDLDAVLAALPVDPTATNICSVLAVAEQESGYRTDPVVPNLPAITLREIDRRAERAHVPRIVVRSVLELPSSTGQSYRARLDRVRTERELSGIFDDFIDRVPLGQRLFARLNPVHTRGPMQVHVDFATQYAEAHRYPFAADAGIPQALFSRRGSLYFGAAHLLDYRAPYDQPIFRFADYNAGRYASRNAAFQRAVAVASGRTLTPDGALLPGDDAAPGTGSTERAVLSLASRLEMSEDAIHRALEKQRDEDFERTTLYRRVYELADAKRGTPLPRAALPQIRLEGPKISRPLTTEWFARRVDGRYQKCMRS